MKPWSLLAPIVIFIYGVRRLRRAPNQGMTLGPRHSTFYGSDGAEWDLEIAPDAETSEENIIYSVIAGMETYVYASSS